MQIEVQMKV